VADSFDLFQLSDLGIDLFRDLLDPRVVFAMRSFSDSISAQRSKASRNSGLRFFVISGSSVSPAFEVVRRRTWLILEPHSPARSRADQHAVHGSPSDDLGLCTAMSHGPSKLDRFGPDVRASGIQPIVFPGALADQLHVAHAPRVLRA